MSHCLSIPIICYFKSKTEYIYSQCYHKIYVLWNWERNFLTSISPTTLHPFVLSTPNHIVQEGQVEGVGLPGGVSPGAAWDVLVQPTVVTGSKIFEFGLSLGAWKYTRNILFCKDDNNQGCNFLNRLMVTDCMAFLTTIIAFIVACNPKSRGIRLTRWQKAFCHIKSVSGSLKNGFILIENVTSTSSSFSTLFSPSLPMFNTL